MMKILGFYRKAKEEPIPDEPNRECPKQSELKFTDWPEWSKYKPIIWRDWITADGNIIKNYKATADFFKYNLNPRESVEGCIILQIDYCTYSIPKLIVAPLYTNFIDILKTFVPTPPLKVTIDGVPLTNDDIQAQIFTLFECGTLTPKSKISIMCKRYGLFGYYYYT